MRLSTRTPDKLPEIEALRRLTKSLAMLDAIICPEWDYRYYSYNSKWGEREEMASMRNGCGDHWFLLFDHNGAALKGFDHESPLAADSAFAESIQKEVPSSFTSFLREPAFSMNLASFCIWRRPSDSQWNVVSSANGRVAAETDGSAELIGILEGNSESYRNWAIDYYEREISILAVEAIYTHRPLDNPLIKALNPAISLSDIHEDAREIGYPMLNQSQFNP